jgi:hypothetical protein
MEVLIFFLVVLAKKLQIATVDFFSCHIIDCNADRVSCLHDRVTTYLLLLVVAAAIVKESS